LGFRRRKKGSYCFDLTPGDVFDQGVRAGSVFRILKKKYSWSGAAILLFCGHFAGVFWKNRVFCDGNWLVKSWWNAW